jgi:glyoxylase I family protein
MNTMPVTTSNAVPDAGSHVDENVDADAVPKRHAPVDVHSGSTAQPTDMASDNPIAIRELDHVVLRVHHLEPMRRFYCDVLGCTVERHQEAIGLLQLRAGASLIDLVPVDSQLGAMGGAAPGREGHNMDHLCLRLRQFDVPRIQAHLRAHGVDPGEVASRFGAEGAGPSIYVQDPEGNTVELKGPPDPAPAGG